MRLFSALTVMLGALAAGGLGTGCLSVSTPAPGAEAPATRPAPRITPRALVQETWGISCLSVASAREAPEHKAELGTQVLLGHSVRVWQEAGSWYLIETADGYRAWLEEGTFVRCSKAELDAWNQSELLIVTAWEEVVREQPAAAAAPVSDVVAGNLVKKAGRQQDWLEVELPDGRRGFLPAGSAQPYALWKTTRRPAPEAIERTARQLLGRPYLWGGNSPKGLDCSGFTKLVFFLNGIELRRNASQQAEQGMAVPLDPEFRHLRKGDLLFFGRRAADGRPPRVTHVGIYLQDKCFIHSSERVQVSSLDPDSSIRDQRRLGRLLFARRILPPDAVNQ